MFGMLLGTLKKAKKELKKDETSALKLKKEEAEKKAVERLNGDRQYEREEYRNQQRKRLGCATPC